MQKKFNTYPSVKEAFICWFVLQHLRGYKPFLTKITFEREFSGNLQEGREDRRAKRKEAEQEVQRKKADELREKGRKHLEEYWSKETIERWEGKK